MRRYLAGPRGKPAAVHSSAAIQRQQFQFQFNLLSTNKTNCYRKQQLQFQFNLLSTNKTI